MIRVRDTDRGTRTTPPEPEKGSLFDAAAFDQERGAIFSTAIGIARLRLDHGDAAGAKEALDSAVNEVHNLHRKMLLDAGYAEAMVNAFLGDER